MTPPVPGRLLAALAVLAFAASGCGKDDVERVAGVDVARAADRTAEKRTARTRMTMRMTGFGAPETSVVMTGVSALDKPKARLEVDLTPAAEGFGLGKPRSGDGVGELLINGPMIHARLPDYEILSDLSGGEEWVAINVRDVADAAGLDTEALGMVLALDPSKQLEAIAATPTLRRVGSEEIDGVRVDHYRGTSRTSDYLRSLPAAKRDRAEKALKRLDEVLETGDEPTEDDIWIDEDGLIRKMISTSKVPASGGVPAGDIVTTCELLDFGAELDLSEPDPGDVLDYTALAIEGAAKLTDER